MPGLDVAPGEEAPGDLVFWKGHVAMVAAPGRVIHANATYMAVTEEDLAVVEARAEGPVIRRLRTGRGEGASTLALPRSGGARAP